MDAFYVSVELLRRPELRGRPVVVGGDAARGVVAAASYEARRFGVHSAMASSRARALCPDAVFVAPDMSLYLEVSSRLHEIFCSFTPLVEQISVDEAFLDVTGAGKLLGDPVQIAWGLRESVRQNESLSCSVGIAPNKFLAKLASEHAKPRATDGGIEEGLRVHQVRPGDEIAFLHRLPVSSLWGVGPATQAKLEDLGIRTVEQLASVDEQLLCRVVGDAHGSHLHRLARGVDDRPVEPERIAKSIGNEETFARDLVTHDEMHAQLVRLCDSVARRTRAAGVAAGTMLLKVKFATFETITRSVTPAVPVTSGPAMVAALGPALAGIDPSRGVRLLGVHAQKLGLSSEAPMRLFEEEDDPVEALERDWSPASRAVDSIIDKFGSGAIGPASVMGQRRRPGESPFGPESG
jgi:DNA polymerase-4